MLFFIKFFFKRVVENLCNVVFLNLGFIKLCLFFKIYYVEVNNKNGIWIFFGYVFCVLIN